MNAPLSVYVFAAAISLVARKQALHAEAMALIGTDVSEASVAPAAGSSASL